MVPKELTINVMSNLNMLIKWYKDTMAGLQCVRNKRNGPLGHS